MHTTISLLSFLLASLPITVATVLPILPQRPISYSSSSQQPYIPSPDGRSYSRGKLDILSCDHSQKISVTYFQSSKVCMPLVPEIPYMISDLTRQLLTEHLEGISFPLSSGPLASVLPIHLEANITEQLHRSEFLLGLSLQLSALKPGLEGIQTSRWRSIMSLLEESAHEVNRGARKRDGSSLASVLMLEAQMEEVHVLAEWKFWRIVDDLAKVCES